MSNNHQLYSVVEDNESNEIITTTTTDETSSILKRPNTILSNPIGSDEEEKSFIKLNNPNTQSIPLDDGCDIGEIVTATATSTTAAAPASTTTTNKVAHFNEDNDYADGINSKKERDHYQYNYNSSSDNESDNGSTCSKGSGKRKKNKSIKEYEGEQGDDEQLEKKESQQNDDTGGNGDDGEEGIDMYGFGKKSKKIKRVIRIINKESDYELEYSFDDFIKFSNDLIQERSNSIKSVPSISDFSQMIKVSLSSPTIQHHSNNNNNYSNINNNNINNNNNNNGNSNNINSSTLTSPLQHPEHHSHLSPNDPTNSKLATSSSSNNNSNNNNNNLTNSQLKQLRNANTFYLNRNPDILSSSSSLLEFSNHLRSTNSPIRNRRNTNNNNNNNNVHQSLIDNSNNSSTNKDGNNRNSNIKTSSSNNFNNDIPTFSISTPRFLDDEPINSNNSNHGSGGIKKNEKVYWIDLEGFSDEEITQVCNLFSVHHLTCEDIISNDSSEKCEEFSNYTFISTSETIYSSTELVQSNIYMCQFSSFIIVFHQHPLDSAETILNSFRYLDNGVLSSSEWVTSIFFEAFNEIYGELSDQLMKEVKVLDDFTLNEDAAHHQELYVRLGKATRKSTNLLSWIFIKSDILSSLIRLNNRNRENRIHLSNIKDRTIRLKQRIKLAEELLENINNAYISKVSLVLNEESHALNISMRKFSALSVIFMPLNLIASIFGMNYHLPGEADEEDQDGHIRNFTAFISILVLMVSIGAILTLFFKRLDWL